MRKTRILILIDDGWGANINLNGEKSNIIDLFKSYDWELTIISSEENPQPCPIAKKYKKPLEFNSIKKASEIRELGNYDALIVLPGRQYNGLIKDKDILELIRKAYKENLAIGAFCRGVKVLVAAGITGGKTITGHIDYLDEYDQSNSMFIGYKDLADKSDAPPPVVDGLLVTALRSNYYRNLTCEAIRICVENSIRHRKPNADKKFIILQMSEDNYIKGELKNKKTKSSAFAIFAKPSEVKNAILCVSSLRKTGGFITNSPISIFIEKGDHLIPKKYKKILNELNCDINDYNVIDELKKYDFCEKSCAAAKAELWATNNRVDELIWLDSDTIFIHEPTELLLDTNFTIGARPVHHLLIGSPVTENLSEYWDSLIKSIGISTNNLFSLKTTIDRVDVRFYINSGLLAIKLKNNILNKWKDALIYLIKNQEIQSKVKTDLQRIFFHQAVLSAVILKNIQPFEFFEFSFSYNFPLHLIDKCPKELRPGKLEDLYSVRYDNWDNIINKNLWEKINISSDFKSWLNSIIEMIEE